MNALLPKTPMEAMQIIARSNFEPFDETDWQIFSGCTSDKPMVCYHPIVEGEQEGEPGMAVIMDGDAFWFVVHDEDADQPFVTYKLVKSG